jgi:NRAMP (natural resistance-associated macrophage protein)-like metal ion transporter
MMACRIPFVSRDASRGSSRSFAAQRTLTQDDDQTELIAEFRNAPQVVQPRSAALLLSLFGMIPMAAQPQVSAERRRHDSTLLDRYRTGHPKPLPQGTFRSLGLGLITGASDDDPAAIGTYAAAGAALGPSFLWVAPVAFPMMFAVVYLSSKLGQVTGQGLFAVLRQHYSKWLLYFLLVTAVAGNIIEAGANLGGMAAALNIIVPVPIRGMVVVLGIFVLSLQIRGYKLIRAIFRWLALALIAYVGAAVLAKPDLWSVVRGTAIPTFHFNKHFFAMLVAVIGTSLSAYLYSWQSNQEVEEDIAMGRRRLSDRMGTTQQELQHSRRDVAWGMVFASVIMYFIILSTASTLFMAGKNDITTAVQAAEALRPLAGKAAGLLFAIGVFGVGFLAVPVMTIGAAFDVCQSFGWRHGLHAEPREAKPFYALLFVFTAAAIGLNFFGINPMKALVYAGIVQGVSTPFLMLLIMLATNNPKVMGRWTNMRATNVIGWLTFAAMSAASIGLLITLAM